MTRGTRGRLAALAISLLVLAGLGWTSGASGRVRTPRAGATQVYQVSYTGSGSYSAKTEAPVACGNDNRDETTNFSWAAQYRLTLSFGKKGSGSASSTVQPVSIPGDDNTSSVAFSGCSGPANCHGDSEPAPGNKTTLKVPAAPSSGRSTWLVGAVGYDGFKPVDFSGTWSAGDPGSCQSWASSGQLLTEEFGVANELQAKFPVKSATMQSLPVGHYFKVHISPGHYAAPKSSFCQPNDGCESDTFSWTGVVRVKRLS